MDRIPLRERKGAPGREEMQLADDDLETGGNRVAPLMWSRGCRVDVLESNGGLS